MQAPAKAKEAIITKAEAAAAAIDIDEASTRTPIDAQLRTRGWCALDCAQITNYAPN
jgi:hypothetical protein